MQFDAIDEPYERVRDDVTAGPEEIAELLDYDGEIGYDALPEAVGGVTIPELSPWSDGVGIEGSSIRIAERYEDRTDEEYLGTVLHELVHGKQYEELAGDDYTQEEMEALLFLHEGQAVFNADGQAYPAGEEFFDEFYDRIGHQDPADALDEMSEEYITGIVQLEDDEGAGIYQLVMLDREEANAADIEDAYQQIADQYGMDIDHEGSYEIDFREYDTEKLADHIVAVQDELEQRYQEIAAERPELLTEPARDTIDYRAMEAVRTDEALLDGAHPAA